MNSEDKTKNGIVHEESPSSSQTNSKTTTDQSKGAIPKTKLTKNTGSASKKTVKINNNLEDMPTLNCVSSSDILKRNGYSKCLSVSNNYLINSSSCTEKDSEPICSKDSCDFNFARHNVPVENDYLNVSLLPSMLNESDVGGGTNGFKENKLPYFQTELICKDQNCQQGKNDYDSDENELLSVSDDGCIYTYKADHVADLPNSFFNLIMPPLENVDEHRDGNSSPEMDFLEMDFDPGPSGDADSDSTSNADIEVISKIPLETIVTIEPKHCCSKKQDVNILETPVQSNTKYRENVQNNNYEQFSKIVKQVCINTEAVIPVRSEIKMPWSCTLAERTQSASHIRSIKRHHNSKGELGSPSECKPSPTEETISNLPSPNESEAASEEIKDKTNKEDEEIILLVEEPPFEEVIEQVMIWSEEEACIKQVTQIAPSSCGATAVLNVLNALRLPLPPIEKIQELVNTRFRANNAPLPQYLLSRSNAGCNHRDLIAGLHKASEERVYSRFFAMYPERVVNLYKWLGYWIKQGAVPIATLNLQKCHGKLPDSWHHQMIFGVGPKGIYLSNPIECVEASQLWPQISSESVLLVKREDILSRWNPRTDFPQLIQMSDVRWRETNVVGQVAKLIRETRRDPRIGTTTTSHIKIPAEYKAGITLAIDIESPAFPLLRQCPELPFLYPKNAAIAFHV